jgi:large subunit ribosomal protein LP0
MGGKSATKAAYFDKLKALLDEYRTVFIVGVDNVSSQQMHEIRIALRGQGVVLMGKNTMVRRALKGFVVENPEFASLMPHVKGEFRTAMNYLLPRNPLTNSCVFYRQRWFHLHQL